MPLYLLVSAAENDLGVGSCCSYIDFLDAGDELGALVQLCLGIIFCIVQRLGKSIVFGFVRVGCVIKDAL